MYLDLRKFQLTYLEYNSDDVISDVPLPLQLLCISECEGQQSRDVEHDFSASEFCVNRMLACLSV